MYYWDKNFNISNVDVGWNDEFWVNIILFCNIYDKFIWLFIFVIC